MSGSADLHRFLLLAAAAAVAFAANAEERRKLSPMAIYGTWLGTQGALPPNCQSDGFLVGFGAVNMESFRMTVAPRTGGVKGAEVASDYKVVEPPATAPVRLEVFLSGEKGDLGIDQLTGSTLEIVPAGPDKTYPVTNLYLRRC